MTMSAIVHIRHVLLVLIFKEGNFCSYWRDFIISELNLIQTLFKLLNWDHRAWS